jgi:UDP-N-acetylglucosamine 2-epimerase (non-hydrolysing)
MTPVRITCVVGARPNFIKIAPLLQELRRRPHWCVRLIHTGQHYSPEMSDNLFQDLDIPEPDLNLGVGGGTAAQQTGAIMAGIEQAFLADRPDILLVVGDVTSTMAAALVAVKMGIRVAHVEAGLRSFDRSMPEEINRLVTDAISDFLFATEPSGVENLRREGVTAEKIAFTGNVMIDTLLRFRTRAAASNVVERFGLQPRGYAVATLHRPSNVDDMVRLRALVDMLQTLGKEVPVVFPVHPRTRDRMEDAGISGEGVLLVKPLGYLDFLRLMDQARLVVTDSGGIQEETTILQVPCLTVRENTERPATVTHGTNQLVGVDPAAVLAAARDVLRREMPQARIPELWDGQASGRIIDFLESALR